MDEVSTAMADEADGRITDTRKMDTSVGTMHKAATTATTEATTTTVKKTLIDSLYMILRKWDL